MYSSANLSITTARLESHLFRINLAHYGKLNIVTSHHEEICRSKTIEDHQTSSYVIANVYVTLKNEGITASFEGTEVSEVSFLFNQCTMSETINKLSM